MSTFKTITDKGLRMKVRTRETDLPRIAYVGVL